MRGRYAAPQMSLTNALDVKAVHNILGEKTPPQTGRPHETAILKSRYIRDTHREPGVAPAREGSGAVLGREVTGGSFLFENAIRASGTSVQDRSSEKKNTSKGTRAHTDRVCRHCFHRNTVYPGNRPRRNGGSINPASVCAVPAVSVDTASSRGRKPSPVRPETRSGGPEPVLLPHLLELDRGSGQP